MLAAVEARARHGEAARSASLDMPKAAWWHSTRRPSIRASMPLVSGYFDQRGRVWEEPIDRNVWSLLERFGDAEIASMVLPRHLVIEHSEVPPFTSGKGAWHTPAGSSVRAEFGRIPQVDAFPRPSLVIGTGDRAVGPVSTDALADFAKRLGFALAAKHPALRRRIAAAASIRLHGTLAPCARSSVTFKGWCARRSTSATRASSLPCCPS